MLDNSCAFTGHRPHKLPWRYNEADKRCVALKTALTDQIVALVETGITDFYSGGANGVDCWAALIVLALKKTNPALRLHCILPHEGQADKWSDSAQERYRSILGQAEDSSGQSEGTGRCNRPPYCDWQHPSSAIDELDDDEEES